MKLVWAMVILTSVGTAIALSGVLVKKKTNKELLQDLEDELAKIKKGLA